MTYQVLVDPEAEVDLTAAFEWYEEQVNGLGHEFLVSVRASLERLERVPLSNQTILADVRRGKLKRFPFGIFYVVRDEKVHVIGFMHSRRDHGEWQVRRKKVVLR